MDTSALEGIGLTRAQTEVYLALLELGETSTGPLIKKSGLQNSVVYHALNQLVKQGLVSYVLKGKRKYFSTTNPKYLLQLIEDKKEKIEKIIPNLLAKQQKKTEKQVQLFVGWKGIYNAFNIILDILPKNSEYIAFGAGFEEQYTEEAKRFFREYQKKRSKMNYKTKIVVNEEARKQVKTYDYYKAFGKPAFRFVPGFAPVGVIVFGEHVLHIAFEDEPVGVMISSSAVAHSFRDCFNAMWKIGKK